MEPKSSSTNIKVAIRIRPFLPAEHEKKLCAHWATQNNIIYQLDEAGHRFGDAYSFDHIFEMNKTNKEIYADVVRDFVTSSIEGLNSTIFAYGQTSSGKTYTMLGDKKDTGIMALAVENIFQSIENNDYRKFLLRVSYMEIYNEKINDLLDPRKKGIKIREYQTSMIGLQNIKEELVSTREQVYDCLKRGNLNRHIGSTQANERSSRSHTIFKIVIESTQINDFDNGGCVQVSNLNLVDLAGSERVAQTKATGVRLKEGGHINKSLSALSLVIKQLSDGQEFVNFRDSKLTRLLQDSLGGNSKTLIIATITLASIEDTASTLAFAQRAKSVKNKPQVNEILTDADVSKRYAALNTQLQKKLEEQMRINKLTQQENERELTRLQQQIEMLEHFQNGSRTPESKQIPKRRHTIGFSEQKQLLHKFSLRDFDKSTQDLHNSNSTLGLIPMQNTSSLTILEPIFEDEVSSSHLHEMPLLSSSPPPTQPTKPPPQEIQEVTPPCRLRMRLSALEKDYNELVTFTRDEENIFGKTSEELDSVRKQLLESQAQVDELKQTLGKTQKELMEYRNEDQLAKFWKNKFKLREQELCSRIAELENEPRECCNVESSDIMNLLLTLQNMLQSPDFDKDVENEHDSVLQIIEKFNMKVKTSKDIIENEILRQICNSDDTHDKIVLSNEIISFNDLLQELSLFESDIPIDLINKMQKESIEDLKILIKIYEFLLRKNAFGKNCSEKIKTLEAEREDSKREIVTLRKNIENLSQAENMNLQNCEITTLRNEIEKLSLEVAERQNKVETLSKKLEISDCKFIEQELLKTDIINLNKVIEELKETNCINEQKMNEEREETRVKVDNLEQEKESLKAENEELKTALEAEKASSVMKEGLADEVSNLSRENMSLKCEITTLRSEIEKLSIEVAEKQNKIETLSKKLEISDGEFIEQELLKTDIANLNKLIEELKETNSINEQKMNEEREETRVKFENLNQEKESLKTENEELKSALEAEKASSVMKEGLSEEVSELSKEKMSLKCEITTLRSEIAKLSLEVAERQNKIETLSKKLEISEQKMNEEREEATVKFGVLEQEKEYLKAEIEGLRTTLEAEQQSSLKQDVDHLKKEASKLSTENSALKLHVTTLKNNIEKLSREITEKDEIISENRAKNVELTTKLENSSLMNAEITRLKNAIENYKENEQRLNQEKEESKLKFNNYEREKQSLIVEIETLKSLKLEERASEMARLKAGTCELLSENVAIKREITDLKNNIEKLLRDVAEKDKCIREQQNQNRELSKNLENSGRQLMEQELLKTEIANLKNTIEKNRESQEEKEELKLKIMKYQQEKNSLTSELEKQKKSISTSEKKAHQSEVQLQRQTVLLNHANSQISQLKEALSEKEKIKCENSQYRMQISLINKKLEEYSKLNEQLRTEIKSLQTNANCDNSSKKEESEELENLLCNIIEQNINEQKALLLIRHPQDKRDRFKNILKDLKSCQTALKQQLRLLQNRSRCNFNELKENVSKSRSLVNDYFTTEKSFIQEQLEQLENTNKEYLQEMMVLKVKTQGINGTCPHCESSKTEILTLKQAVTSLQETLESLMSKNTELRNENMTRMKEVVRLQEEIYKEQDRKAEVAYTDWLKFCEENYKIAQQEVKTLQKQVKYLKEQVSQKRGGTQLTSVEIQCNLNEGGTTLEEKYDMMKNLCRIRNRTISQLQSEITRLKNIKEA